MSMEKIIRKMKEDGFEEYLNKRKAQPIEKTENSIITYDDKGIGWVTCPYCKKRQFPISKGAIIKNQIFKCKASYCKKYFKTNI